METPWLRHAPPRRYDPLVEQLTGLDASFLNLETPTQQGHVGGVVILDPSTAPDGWGLAELTTLIEARIHLLPPFRRRLLPVPLGVDQPYWIEDPDFDLSYHLRHIAVPAPGGKEQLAELVARIHERPLDRARPLWEIYLIEGLEDGHVATYTKLHHAAVDGISGTEILTILLDPSAEGRDVPAAQEWRPDRIPGGVELLARSVASAAVRPVKAVRFGYELVRSIPGLKPIEQVVARVGRRRSSDAVVTHPKLVAPRSVLSQPITPHRRWAYGDVELADVKAIKNAAGVTVNDVVIAATAGAVRRWLIVHDALPDRSLQAMIPVSTRAGDNEGVIGNRVSALVAPIGTHIADPIERLHHVNRTMQVAKDQHAAIPATLLQDFAQFTPPAIAARAARVVFRNGRAGRVTPFNLVISNVPGPHFPLYLAGARLLGHYPVSAITDGIGLNVTLHSYLGRLCFGLVADRELVPDLWDLFTWIGDEVDELREALA